MMQGFDIVSGKHYWYSAGETYVCEGCSDCKAVDDRIDAPFLSAVASNALDSAEDTVTTAIGNPESFEIPSSFPSDE